MVRNGGHLVIVRTDVMKIKNSFDKDTVQSILRGAMIAGTGASSLYILGALETIDFGSNLTPIIGALVPILTNIIHEWRKGASFIR